MRASLKTGASPSRRQWALALALGATTAACMWAAQLPDQALPDLADAAPARRSMPGGAGAEASARTQPWRWTAPPREPWPEAESAALAAWQPVPPPQVQLPPKSRAQPAPPQAPSFPYQLIGRLVQTGSVQALLGSEQRSLAVQAGDTIDGQWRVQSIGEDSLELLWLPGPLPQTLRFKPL
ncbi:hypothetical protein ACS5PK_15160 [Roseateles sp. DB2]|uniref:hypothetical protein n=1 Tax=Roseateles sp. DB2 TaxID=3453717 RepID=UPI003EE9F093